METIIIFRNSLQARLAVEINYLKKQVEIQQIMSQNLKNDNESLVSENSLAEEQILLIEGC